MKTRISASVSRIPRAQAKSTWVFGFYFILSVVNPSWVHAWGQYGHQQINDAAITLLNEVLGESSSFGKCLNNNRYVMKRYAITPDADWKAEMRMNLDPKDLAKRRDNDRYEHPLHYFEVDGLFPELKPGQIMADLPSGEFANVFPFLKSQMEKNISYLTQINPEKKFKDSCNLSDHDVANDGTAPWRSLQLYRLAVAALRSQDIPLALYYLGTLGHYIGDLSQPFHTTLNYDGQYFPPNNASGIHHEVDTGVLPKGKKDDKDVFYAESFQETEGAVIHFAKNELQKLGTEVLTEDRFIPEIYKMIDSGYPKIQFLLKTFSKVVAGLDDDGLKALEMPLHHTHRIPESHPKATILRAGGGHSSRLPVRLEREFTSKVLDTVEERLGVSAALLARIWSSAYIAAGSPSLDECRTQDFDISYAIQNYPRPTQDGPQGYLSPESVSTPKKAHEAIVAQ